MVDGSSDGEDLGEGLGVRPESPLFFPRVPEGKRVLLFVWLSGSWMKERRKALFFCSYSVGGGSDFLSSFGFHLLVVEFMKTRFEIREQIGHNIDLRMSDAKTVPIRFATS